MQSILANVLHSHDKHEACWFKIKIKPKPDPDMSSPLDEAPGEYCFSKLLGVMAQMAGYVNPGKVAPAGEGMDR
jgi:hypothetical protein